MKFTILLVFLFMSLANPIAGGKLFPGFNNPEKWMKRVIRKLQRKTSAYGSMIASNTAEISYNAGFISSMKCDSSGYINDPENGLSCCYEDNLNKGQCLCKGMTIDDKSNPGSCCMANPDHPDDCLCSGTEMDDPTNPGNCCFANSGQCLCTGNYTDDSSKRCFNLDWKGDGICDDQNNHGGCNFDGGDCCGDDVDTDLCTQCQCLEEEAPLPNAVGCCYKEENNPQECLCTGTEIDDPDTPVSCCMDDVDNPGNCYRTCPDDCTNPLQGICDTSTGICDCKPGFAGHNCAEACTANQITNVDICQDCSAGEVPDVMLNLTACVACNPEEITNNGSCQACPEGQVSNTDQTVCETMKEGGVQLKDGKFPEVFLNGIWSPICGHYFWDNDFGAQLFCQELTSNPASTGQVIRTNKPLEKDALIIGLCLSSDTWLSCSGGCNDLVTGLGCYNCSAGQLASIEIKCSQGSRSKMSNFI